MEHGHNGIAERDAMQHATPTMRQKMDAYRQWNKDSQPEDHHGPRRRHSDDHRTRRLDILSKTVPNQTRIVAVKIFTNDWTRQSNVP